MATIIENAVCNILYRDNWVVWRTRGDISVVLTKTKERCTLLHFWGVTFVVLPLSESDLEPGVKSNWVGFQKPAIKCWFNIFSNRTVQSHLCLQQMSVWLLIYTELVLRIHQTCHISLFLFRVLNTSFKLFFTNI